MTDLITRALRNATDTRAVVIGEEAVERTGEVFTELFGAARAIVVADERTFALAGKRVSEALDAAGVELADPHVFPGEPELYAKYENCEALRDALAPVDAIAVAAPARSTTSRNGPPGNSAGPTWWSAPRPPWTATPLSVPRSPSTGSNRR